MNEDPHAGHDGALDYHRRMIGDPHRVHAYERALRVLVKPGDVVLDLGAGTGFLSMLAARRGARVHAVESMSIAAVAQRLVNDNGLAGQVRVHHADVRDLEPLEPVDLIVSDFMGRFVADDFMLEAMQAALRWLKPGGRVCPERVDLQLAPVMTEHFASLDVFTQAVAGLDLEALVDVTLNWTYAVQVPVEDVMAPAVLHAVVRPGSGPAAFAGRHRFVVAKAGRLRGFAGWFEAAMAPGVVLSTAPGVETHWGQMLFPVAALAVAEGDVIEVDLGVDDTEPGSYLWRWTGEVQRAGQEPVAFNHQSVGQVTSGDPRVVPMLDHDALDALNVRGAAAFAVQDYAGAAAAFKAAVKGLGPEHDALAPLLWENLGLALSLSNQPEPAVGAFLRALDGDLTSREQSARYLVDACQASDRWRDAARYRAAYEAHFGPHPSRNG